MFSLIITIISIALVAALALATLYYGGSAFNKGTTGASAARLINEGQQINGAVQIARADAAAESAGHVPLEDGVTKLSALVPTYMAQLPAGWDGEVFVSGNVSTVLAKSDAICAEVNNKAGLSTVDAIAGTNSVYGCVTAEGADKNKVFYRF